MKFYKPVSYFIQSCFARRKKYQAFFELMHRFSMLAMNYGYGSNLMQSGELKAMEYVCLLLPGDAIVFDVGAYKGAYAKSILQLLPGGKIFCFEPAKETFSMLCHNLKEYKNVYLHQLGFNDQEGEVILYGTENNAAIASLLPTTVNHEKYGLRIEEKIVATTIDAFCRANNIEQIDFVKIDVEGNELKVLHGAATLLQSCRISFIQFEFGRFNMDSRTYFRDFWILLSPLYKIYRIVKDGVYEIKNYDEQLEIFSTSNFIAELKTLR